MKKNVWVTLSALIFSPLAAHGLTSSDLSSNAGVNSDSSPREETAAAPDSLQLARSENPASSMAPAAKQITPYHYQKRPKHHHTHHQLTTKKPSEATPSEEPRVTLSEESSAPETGAVGPSPLNPNTTMSSNEPATAAANTIEPTIAKIAPSANNTPTVTLATTTPASAAENTTSPNIAAQSETNATRDKLLLARNEPAPNNDPVINNDPPANTQPLVATNDFAPNTDPPAAATDDSISTQAANNVPSPSTDPTPPANNSVGMDDEDTANQATRHGIDTFLQDQQVVLTRRLTLTGGISYTGYDRRQLTLNGFLALDSIFLGNISVSEVRSYSTRFDLGARYGISDKVQIAFNAPFIHRMTNFIKQGVNGSSTMIASTDVSTSMRIGDVTTSVYVEALPEQVNLPAIIWNAEIKWPSGKNPYGIKTKDISPDNLTVFIVPTDLPTGDGLYMLSSGFSFTKTIDPAVIFANIMYHHYFAREFGDISGNPGSQIRGWIRLADYWTYGAGVAFALNDRTSLSFSYTQDVSKLDRVREEGHDWITQRGTDAQPASMNAGFTYGITNNLAVIANVQLGLNQDAPDFVASLKLPYTFD